MIPGAVIQNAASADLRVLLGSSGQNSLDDSAGHGWNLTRRDAA